LKGGQLEVVLPQWEIPEKDLFLVYPSGESRSPRIIALLHALLNRLEATEGIHLVALAKQLPLSR
jgi:DNA-binding transcriptional LysR family regulator